MPVSYDLRMKIYTKTGDSGETSLLSGGRVAKDHPRIATYGTLDELNSVIGLLLAEPVPTRCVSPLEGVQRSLFSLGAAIADAHGKLPHDSSDWAVEPIESWIDEMDGELEPLRNFILPGGCRAAAIAHIARTVCRRAERCAIRAGREDGALPYGMLEYMNRLSDSFFVLARWLNGQIGVADRLWPQDGPESGGGDEE